MSGMNSEQTRSLGGLPALHGDDRSVACTAGHLSGEKVRRLLTLASFYIGMTWIAGGILHPDADPLRAAAPEPDMSLYSVAQVGGSVRAVAAGGGRLYVAIGQRLEAWQARSDAGEPRRLGRWEGLTGPAVALAVEGRRVYALVADPMLAGQGFRLEVLDWNDPARPEFLGRMTLPGAPMDLQVSGGWLYVAALTGGWQVIDGRDPARLRMVAQQPLVAMRTALADDRAAVAAGGALWLMDIADPEIPTQLGLVVNGGQDVALADGILYWARVDHQAIFMEPIEAVLEDFGQGSRRLDVDLGAAPQLLAAGQRLFVAGSTGVEAFDVSQSSDAGRTLQPRALGRLDLPSVAVASLASDGQRLVLAAGAAGTRVFELRGNGLPRALPAPAEPGDPRQAVVLEDRLYLAGGASGFWILDIGQPREPKLLAHVDLPNVEALRIRAGLGYLACGRTGLFIVDLADPARPAVLSNFKTPDVVTDIVLAGDLAYLAGGRSGIRVADIADPRAPRFVGAYEAPGFDPLALDIDAEAGLLLAATGDAGLEVFELGEDGLPQPIGFYRTPDAATDVAFVAGRAVVGYRQAGLRAFDLEDPSRPRLLDFLLLRDFRAMQLDGRPEGEAAEAGAGEGQTGRLWLAAGREGLGRVSLSPEGRWQWLGSGQRPGPALTMVGPAGGSAGDLVYAAAGDEGLLLLAPRPSQRIWLPMVMRP